MAADTAAEADGANDGRRSRARSAEKGGASGRRDDGAYAAAPRRGESADGGSPAPESSVASFRAIALERKPATSSALRLSFKRADHGEGGPSSMIFWLDTGLRGRWWYAD